MARDERICFAIEPSYQGDQPSFVNAYVYCYDRIENSDEASSKPQVLTAVYKYLEHTVNDRRWKIGELSRILADEQDRQTADLLIVCLKTLGRIQDVLGVVWDQELGWIVEIKINTEPVRIVEPFWLSG